MDFGLEITMVLAMNIDKLDLANLLKYVMALRKIGLCHVH